ncbi:hypothetical protein M427DRAFT_135877 [Gonapodya prolifera JEL478]|uniref:Uncharacterized protein n=1 Tax=Gonapodya prolifera (strain JEL478) TaxID=1344416 RepID=A0A139ACX4_GONPJ|nr:hypothetical protein M427DRAFT_135877 [Gonapodya prolifera JEL478]|eukprot:KXS14263.1 hypothetical protein M427DRAFT_135877 [Gonapodya prolifera JEL478]
MKCVLFVFGKTEENVKGWGETAKMLNVELLKKMQAYDPTAVQKKKRFERIRKLLSTIQTDEIRKHASLPTQLMHNWLIVSLALRDKAVKERKRLKEAPSSGTLGSMDDGGDEEDDSVLDGGVDAGTD